MVARSHTGLPAMRNTLLPLVVACGLVFLGAEVWAWQTNISGTAGGGVVNAAAVDGAGNVVAAGSTNNTGTGDDFTVVKLDRASGAELWRQTLPVAGPGQGDDTAYTVAVDGDGNVVAAGSIFRAGSGDGFTVVKLDGASGAELWRIVLGNECCSSAEAVAVDGAGNVVAAGVIVRPAGGYNFAVIEGDGASGTQWWRRDIDSGGSDHANAVTVDEARNVAAAGQLKGTQFAVIKLDGASGTELWRQGSDSLLGEANAVAVDGAGNVAVVGYTSNPGTGTDFTVIKLDGSSGTEWWRQIIDGAGGANGSNDVANAVAICATGNVAVAGKIMTANAPGTHPAWVVMDFDGASGTERWRKVAGDIDDALNSANAIVVDMAGNVVAAGSINSMGTHYFAITKYDGASGTELWQHHIRLGIAHEIVVDGAGDVIAAGIVGSAGTVVKLRGADGGDFMPPDTEPPTVTITSPANLAIVSGTVTVSADASDNVGVAGVQFQLDGAPLGPEDTEGPYAVNWDTATTGIGQHTLTAVARDAAGNRATTAPVTVTVVNLPALPGL